jgi:hypothetical protein
VFAFSGDFGVDTGLNAATTGVSCGGVELFIPFGASCRNCSTSFPRLSGIIAGLPLACASNATFSYAVSCLSFSACAAISSFVIITHYSLNKN